MIKSHLGASTTPQAAHTERLYKQTPLSFYVKEKHQKASQATLENHPEGSNGDLGRPASGFITTARRTARPPARRAARPPTGPGEAGSRTRQALRPSADRRAASRPGQAAPETADAGPRRRSPGPAVHGHMSLRGRRRPAPARPHPAWDALLRAAAGPRRPPRPRGDSTAATPPPPPPPPPGSRDPAGGGGGSATFREPGSRREGEGAHGDAPCGCTWPRGPRAEPALLLSWAPAPAAAVLEKHFCPRVPTSRLPFIPSSELKWVLPLLPPSSCGRASALGKPEPPPRDSGMFRL